MKKFVILLLICLCFLLCSCSADTSGYQNELTCTDWSAELDGGGRISLSFDGENASLIMMSGKDKAELCGKYAEVSVILFSKSNSSENSILLIYYCLPICFNVSEISCSTGKALSSVASTGETSDGE